MRLNYTYIFSNYDDPTSTSFTYTKPPPPPAFPAALMMLSAVMLLMTFYNQLLCARGFTSTWKMWDKFRHNTISPTLDLIHSKLRGVMFDDDSPISLTKPKRLPRKQTFTSRRKRAMLAVFSLIAGRSVAGSSLTLQSETERRDHLRNYHDYRGMLSTVNLPECTRNDVLQTIASDAELFSTLAQQRTDVLYVIVDTGCSITCTNDPSDFDKGTLRKLPKPKQIGGIAGGIEVQYEGIATWESLDEDGNVIMFRTKALLAPSLPCRLFSP